MNRTLVALAAAGTLAVTGCQATNPAGAPPSDPAARSSSETAAPANPASTPQTDPDPNSEMTTGYSTPAPATTTGPPTAQPDAAPSTPATTAPPKPAPTMAVVPVPVDDRRGSDLDRPFTVDGIIVVSKKHPISRRYSPAQPAAHGLTRKAAAALARMTAAARKDGVRIVVRSGYRSYSMQAAIFARKLRSYPNETLAKRYNAQAGESEHQTGLAADLFDGRTWGLGVRNTATGKWLWRNAHKYGFILRYPPGKEKITGYAYEPWHFRYIGVQQSQRFGPRSTKTLEEYLGLV